MYSGAEGLGAEGLGAQVAQSLQGDKVTYISNVRLFAQPEWLPCVYKSRLSKTSSARPILALDDQLLAVFGLGRAKTIPVR